MELFCSILSLMNKDHAVTVWVYLRHQTPISFGGFKAVTLSALKRTKALLVSEDFWSSSTQFSIKVPRGKSAYWQFSTLWDYRLCKLSLDHKSSSIGEKLSCIKITQINSKNKMWVLLESEKAILE